MLGQFQALGKPVRVERRGAPTLTRSLRCSIGSLHTRQSLCYPLKKVLDVVTQLRTRLDEHEVVLLGLLLTLLCSNLPLVVEIRLVANQHDNHIVASLGSYVVDPLLGVLERLGVYKEVQC